MSEEELITGAEAARYLGISRSRINKLAHQGRLGRQIAGRFYVFTRAELDAFKATPKSKGGRPKLAAGTLSPARPAWSMRQRWSPAKPDQLIAFTNKGQPNQRRAPCASPPWATNRRT